MSFLTDSARWLAVSSRDPRANDAFIYGVKSTAIYCRPTCPARLARRANVIFLRNVSEAERLGYRPCKRCKPNVGGAGDAGADVVRKVKDAVSAKLDREEEVKLGDVSRDLGLTASYVARVFKERTGLSVGQWAAHQTKVYQELDVAHEHERSPPSMIGPDTFADSLQHRREREQDEQTSVSPQSDFASFENSCVHTPESMDLEYLLRRSRSSDDIASPKTTLQTRQSTPEFSLDDFICSDAWSNEVQHTLPVILA